MGERMDDLRRRVRQRIKHEGIPVGSDNPLLNALGAPPLSGHGVPDVCLLADDEYEAIYPRLRFGNDPWLEPSTYEEEQFTPEPREEGEVVGCWPSWGELHDLGSPSRYRHWVRCGDCGVRLTASSEDRLRVRMAEHAP